jgi:hypothetical protein
MLIHPSSHIGLKNYKLGRLGMDRSYQFLFLRNNLPQMRLGRYCRARKEQEPEALTPSEYTACRQKLARGIRKSQK